MTHTMNYMLQPQQQPQFFGAMSPTGAMFQQGYAGTNVQEVQHWNHGGHAQSIGTPITGMSYGGAQSVFSPGFANTNVQEVRQLNQAGYPQQQQQQQYGYGQNQALQSMQNQFTGYAQGQQAGYMQAQPSYQQSYGQGGNSIFSPGFAGTNVQEVQARNQVGYSGYGGQAGYTNQSAYPQAMTGSIFSPGFANTNVQEVRQLNNTGYGMQAQQGQQQQSQLQPQAYANQAYSNQAGAGAQSVFSPGFAGTNTQEVRQLNTPGQMAPHTGSIFPGTF
ncbi:hypothetical protein P4V43_02060 [Brevibacillus fortis]|uniref:Uncharacterized protein n=1 Tax=Brevibacillus fortis TaxID=2126352 RepID=A0A2P7UPQ3_9BACL|nr:hypothetical protein [Brevibacillus fortis]MED1780604.1 hypothetical protein [Brevibacillus fortis]PSJ88803.1 hypothetical protein C7R93_24300 [Brevibacillus fortis]